MKQLERLAIPHCYRALFTSEYFPFTFHNDQFTLSRRIPLAFLHEPRNDAIDSK